MCQTTIRLCYHTFRDYDKTRVTRPHPRIVSPGKDTRHCRRRALAHACNVFTAWARPTVTNAMKHDGSGARSIFVSADDSVRGRERCHA